MSSQKLKKILIYNYQDIRLLPNHPRPWLARSATLLRLGYGELTVSDAYKARLLVESFLYPKAKPFSELAIKVYSSIAAELGLGAQSTTIDRDAQVFKALKYYEKTAFYYMHESLVQFEPGMMTWRCSKLLATDFPITQL